MEIEKRDIFIDIKNIIELSRKKVISSINSTMTTTYFLIGKRIVEEEQGGEKRAEYGENLIIKLSEKLTRDYGKGFSKRNLEQMRKFYLTYSISQTVSAEFKLSYSHYLTLMRVANIEERNFYEIEAINNSWSLRELKRQMDSALYERLVLSRDKEKVLELSQKGQLIEKPQDIIKDPYILEFLGLDEKAIYSENDLETAIINHIEKFIMKLGKGFLFQGRQVRFIFDEEHFFVDLVFYNSCLLYTSDAADE